MKKLMLLLLIAFLSCSDSEKFEPEEPEPEPTCFYVYGKSTGNGWSTYCNTDRTGSEFLLILIDERTWLSGNYTRRDALEICVTNEDYKFNDINLRQKICNIEDFTN